MPPDQANSALKIRISLPARGSAVQEFSHIPPVSCSTCRYFTCRLSQYCLVTCKSSNKRKSSLRSLFLKQLCLQYEPSGHSGRHFCHKSFYASVTSVTSGSGLWYSAPPTPRINLQISLKTGRASSTPNTLPFPKAFASFRPSGIPIRNPAPSRT